jgi:hypothetical protein
MRNWSKKTLSWNIFVKLKTFYTTKKKKYKIILEVYIVESWRVINEPNQSSMSLINTHALGLT